MTTAALTCEDMRVLLEIHDADLFAAWDTTDTWDDDSLVWEVDDDLTKLRYDVRDQLRGFVLELGRQGSWDDLLAATLTLELDNSSGLFAIFGYEQLPRIRPGIALELQCRWDETWYTQFVGSVTEYVESGEPNNYTVRLKAVDSFRRLMDPIEGEYHAGTDAQPALDRIKGLLAMAGMDTAPFYGEPSTATMTNYATSRSLLDEIRMTSRSDCGVFFVDRDGTITYLNRDRIFGRVPDDLVWTFGDACDGSELPFAAVEPIVADNEFGNVITVSNVSMGTDSPSAGIAVSQPSIDAYGRIPWAPSQLLICNADFVQGAADFHLKLRSQAYYRVNSFECYPVHDDRLWPVLLGLRLYDLIYVNRRPPNAAPLVGVMIVDGMRIEATPNMWKFTIRCSPAAGYAAASIIWDYTAGAVWDGSSLWA
jgi:PAS domain-containing protein